MWPKLGFVAQYELPGRGRDKKILTYWWYDHGHPNLFTPDLSTENNRISVVLDANIFFDLHQHQDTNCTVESKALFADWLIDCLDFYLTDEIFNEIDRAPDKDKREYQRKMANHYEIISYDRQKYTIITNSIRSLFPSKLSTSDRSDIAQIAKTISSGIKFFVTRDNELLAKNSIIYKDYGVSIVRPSDLIIRMDELQRNSEYSPARLVGTSLVIKRIQYREQYLLAEAFQGNTLGEKKNHFNRQICFFLADPPKYTCQIIQENDSPLALIVYERANIHELNIPMLRITNSPLASTVVRNLIYTSVIKSADEKRILTKVTDPYINQAIVTALHENAFIRTAQGFIKINIPHLIKAEDLNSYILKNICEIRDKYSFLNNTTQILYNSELRVLHNSKNQYSKSNY